MKKKSSYLSDFIKDVIDEKYRTRSLAAEDLGVDESVMSRICSGKRPGVSEKIIEKICDKLGLDKSEGVLKLFLTKHSKIKQFFSKPKEPITFTVIHPNSNDKAINPKKISENYSPVPLITSESLDGCISLKHRASEHALVPNSWLHQDHNIQCSVVKGNSMAPTLPDGSIAAIDFDNRALESRNIYLLKWKNKVVIKRVFIQDVYLLLSSDNPEKGKYPIEVCSMKKAKSIKDSPILGRVIWSMAKG